MPRLPSRIQSVGSATQKAFTQATGVTAREQSGSRQFNAAQENLRNATAAIGALPWGDGNMLEGVAHKASSTLQLNHLLNRAARGAFPVLILGSAAPNWCVTSLGTATDKRISVFTTQDCTVNWWVY